MTTNIATDFLMTLHLARKFYAEAKEAREAEERSHAEEGHRPHYCIHGTNQWTDYDNICGGCEDGVTLRQMCVQRAADVVRTFNERTAWLRDSPFAERLLKDLWTMTAKEFSAHFA